MALASEYGKLATYEELRASCHGGEHGYLRRKTIHFSQFNIFKIAALRDLGNSAYVDVGPHGVRSDSDHRPRRAHPNQLHDGTAAFMGHYNSNQKLRLVIGLQHPHLAEEEQFLKELHTKGSPNGRMERPFCSVGGG